MEANIDNGTAPQGRTGRPRTFAAFSEMPDDGVVPRLDRQDADESGLDADELSWRRLGYLHLSKFIPRPLMDAYCRVREKLGRPGGWESPTPYLHVKEIRGICCYPPLYRLLTKLIGGPMGLHLNLTGWVSTERTWHQDDYLNPATVNSWYAAVWFALEDIHEDSGPFEFIPGSHRWPIVRRDRVLAELPPEEANTRAWPIHAERFVTGLYEEKIQASGLPVVPFLGRRGDVLIWHGRLAHRGSRARRPGMPRRALIAHYSELSHRPDLPHHAWTAMGVPMFLFKEPLH